MKGMKIITAGPTFLDIDAYACAIAYAELLRRQGDDAIAYSSATINESVSKTIRSWDASFLTEYVPTDDDTFILVDVSDPDYLDKAVDIDRIEEVIDHHVGFEAFWRDRIGDKADIEFIGAACTQIYEKWLAADLVASMSKTSARLLISGILDNTLNFKAAVTTDRDRAAYDALLAVADLPDGWTAQYFSECQESIFGDIECALTNDTKMMTLSNIDTDAIAFGQLVIWSGERATNEYRGRIEASMTSKSAHWFVNIVSIAEGRSRLLCSDEIVKEWAEKVLAVMFTNNIAQADRLWLRKEIFKQDQMYAAPDSLA
ncbi:putative manganese-dependent inorganic pyrophosphatase [compost metagenome]